MSEPEAPLRYAYVKWVDSCMKYEQLSPHELPTPLCIESVGIVVGEGADYVTLARDRHADKDCRGVISIPRCAIVQMSTLAQSDQEERTHVG